MELKEAEALAKAKMKLHGIDLLGWTFEFDNAKRRLGLCSYKRKKISLSRHFVLLNEEPKILDTILHEIAHALVGNTHGHDNVWKRKALEIGCNGNRCAQAHEVKSVEGNYKAVCPNGHEFRAFRRRKRNQSCGHCSHGVYNPEFKLVWEKVKK